MIRIASGVRPRGSDVIGIYWIALGIIELSSQSLFFLTIFLGFWLVIFGVTLIVRGFGLRSAANVTKPMARSPVE